MMIIALALALSILYFAVEAVKSKWLRHGFHVAVLFGGMSLAFRFGLSTGNETARGDVSREIQEVIEIVREASITNSSQGIRLQLDILKREIPKVIVERDRLPLLRELQLIKE